MEAGKRTINDIFNGNRILEIPFFQRAYVWEEKQWERLLEDMELITESKKPYFLGSLILKQKQTSTENINGDMRTLIDGQQRLTTLNIFFKVLYLKNNDNESFEFYFKLRNNKLDKHKNMTILHNHNDIDSFQKVLNLEELIELKVKELGVEDRIIETYEYFRKKINPDKLDSQTLLNNIMFVGIDLGIEDDEQQIFDTINSLGVSLTTAELLKNYFFNRNNLKDYETYWKNVFEKDDETKKYWDNEITTGRLRRAFIDLFFYSFLQIKIQQSDLKVKTEDKIEFSKVDTLFDSYKKLIKEYNLNKNDLLIEINEYAMLFERNFNYGIIERELTRDFGIERINVIIFGLETSTLIPYVLFVLKNEVDENNRNELFALLESYLMRRLVVNATTKNYNQLFTDSLISSKILSKQQLKEYLNNRNDKTNYLPDDEELKNGFDNSTLINKQSLGIIYFLESKIRDERKHATSLLGINKYTLEHLMPKKWENKWSKLLTKEDVDFRNFKLKTLGNLTIITQSLNASIRDSDWKTKKNGNEKKKGLKDYSAGIETLTAYLEKPEWNEEEIKNRANFLFEKAKEIWKDE